MTLIHGIVTNRLFYSYLQGCTDVYNSLRNGNFGACETETADYKVQCQKHYPFATVFKDQSLITAMENHKISDDNLQDNESK